MSDISTDVIKALETRIGQNRAVIKNIANDNKRLIAKIESHLLALPLDQSAAKWHEIKIRLESILCTIYKNTSISKFTLAECNVILEKHVSTDEHVVWIWKLLHRVELTGGRHRKCTLLNPLSIMPAYCESNEEFIQYLCDNLYIDVHIY